MRKFIFIALLSIHVLSQTNPCGGTDLSNIFYPIIGEQFIYPLNNLFSGPSPTFSALSGTTTIPVTQYTSLGQSSNGFTKGTNAVVATAAQYVNFNQQLPTGLYASLVLSGGNYQVYTEQVQSNGNVVVTTVGSTLSQTSSTCTSIQFVSNTYMVVGCIQSNNQVFYFVSTTASTQTTLTPVTTSSAITTGYTSVSMQVFPGASPIIQLLYLYSNNNNNVLAFTVQAPSGQTTTFSVTAATANPLLSQAGVSDYFQTTNSICVLISTLGVTCYPNLGNTTANITYSPFYSNQYTALDLYEINAPAGIIYLGAVSTTQNVALFTYQGLTFTQLQTFNLPVFQTPSTNYQLFLNKNFIVYTDGLNDIVFPGRDLFQTSSILYQQSSTTQHQFIFDQNNQLYLFNSGSEQFVVQLSIPVINIPDTSSLTQTTYPVTITATYLEGSCQLQASILPFTDQNKATLQYSNLFQILKKQSVELLYPTGLSIPLGTYCIGQNLQYTVSSTATPGLTNPTINQINPINYSYTIQSVPSFVENVQGSDNIVYQYVQYTNNTLAVYQCLNNCSLINSINLNAEVQDIAFDPLNSQLVVLLVGNSTNLFVYQGNNSVAPLILTVPSADNTTTIQDILFFNGLFIVSTITGDNQGELCYTSNLTLSSASQPTCQSLTYTPNKIYVNPLAFDQLLFVDTGVQLNIFLATESGLTPVTPVNTITYGIATGQSVGIGLTIDGIFVALSSTDTLQGTITFYSKNYVLTVENSNGNMVNYKAVLPIINSNFYISNPVVSTYSNEYFYVTGYVSGDSNQTEYVYVYQGSPVIFNSLYQIEQIGQGVQSISAISQGQKDLFTYINENNTISNAQVFYNPSLSMDTLNSSEYSVSGSSGFTVSQNNVASKTIQFTYTVYNVGMNIEENAAQSSNQLSLTFTTDGQSTLATFQPQTLFSGQILNYQATCVSSQNCQNISLTQTIEAQPNSNAPKNPLAFYQTSNGSIFILTATQIYEYVNSTLVNNQTTNYNSVFTIDKTVTLTTPLVFFIESVTGIPVIIQNIMTTATPPVAGLQIIAGSQILTDTSVSKLLQGYYQQNGLLILIAGTTTSSTAYQYMFSIQNGLVSSLAIGDPFVLLQYSSISFINISTVQSNLAYGLLAVYNEVLTLYAQEIELSTNSSLPPTIVTSQTFILAYQNLFAQWSSSNPPTLEACIQIGQLSNDNITLLFMTDQQHFIGSFAIVQNTSVNYELYEGYGFEDISFLQNYDTEFDESGSNTTSQTTPSQSTNTTNTSTTQTNTTIYVASIVNQNYYLNPYGIMTPLYQYAQVNSEIIMIPYASSQNITFALYPVPSFTNIPVTSQGINIIGGQTLTINTDQYSQYQNGGIPFQLFSNGQLMTMDLAQVTLPIQTSPSLTLNFTLPEDANTPVLVELTASNYLQSSTFQVALNPSSSSSSKKSIWIWLGPVIAGIVIIIIIILVVCLKRRSDAQYKLMH